MANISEVAVRRLAVAAVLALVAASSAAKAADEPPIYQRRPSTLFEATMSAGAGGFERPARAAKPQPRHPEPLLQAQTTTAAYGAAIQLDQRRAHGTEASRLRDLDRFARKGAITLEHYRQRQQAILRGEP